MASIFFTQNELFFADRLVVCLSGPVFVIFRSLILLSFIAFHILNMRKNPVLFGLSDINKILRFRQNRNELIINFRLIFLCFLTKKVVFLLKLFPFLSCFPFLSFPFSSKPIEDNVVESCKRLIKDCLLKLFFCKGYKRIQLFFYLGRFLTASRVGSLFQGIFLSCYPFRISSSFCYNSISSSNLLSVPFKVPQVL